MNGRTQYPAGLDTINIGFVNLLALPATFGLLVVSSPDRARMAAFACAAIELRLDAHWVIRALMCARLLGMVLSVLLLFGSGIVMPAAGATPSGSNRSVAAFMCVDCNDESPSDQQSPTKAPGSCHHHCTYAVGLKETRLDVTSGLVTLRPIHSSHPSLSSLTRAPPTQPPSA